MSKGWSYTSGDWWVICDVCAKKTHASEIKKRWDGLLVCTEDFETRHPQDFVRARTDKIAVPFSRPPPEQEAYSDITYINDYVVSPYTVEDIYYVEPAEL